MWVCPWGGMSGSCSPFWGALGVLATSGLEELQVMLVVNTHPIPPPRLLEMGLSEEEQGEGSRERLCPALPWLVGQVQGAPAPAVAPGTQPPPTGCGCCNPREPPAPRWLQDMLCGRDRGVGQEGRGEGGGYISAISFPVPIPGASGLVAQAAGGARLAGSAARGEQD